MNQSIHQSRIQHWKKNRKTGDNSLSDDCVCQIKKEYPRDSRSWILNTQISLRMLGRFAARASRLHTNRFTSAFLSTMVPSSMPSVEIFSATFPDPKRINIADYCAGKKGFSSVFQVHLHPPDPPSRSQDTLSNRKRSRLLGLRGDCLLCKRSRRQ